MDLNFTSVISVVFVSGKKKGQIVPPSGSRMLLPSFLAGLLCFYDSYGHVSYDTNTATNASEQLRRNKNPNKN